MSIRPAYRCLPLLLGAALAHAADPLIVRVVPMNGASPELPHITYGDGTAKTRFKAVASGGTAGPSGTSYAYRWDFNADGVWDSGPTTVSTANGVGDLHAEWAYPVYADDRDFNARVEVVNGAETVSATYRVRVYAQANATPAIRTEKAIDDGLWWLHRRLARAGTPGTPTSTAWLGNGSNGHSLASTALAIQVLQNGGHLVQRARSLDPYVDDVLAMHNHLLGKLATTTIGAQAAGNPDSNGNGKGLALPDGIEGRTERFGPDLAGHRRHPRPARHRRSQRCARAVLSRHRPGHGRLDRLGPGRDLGGQGTRTLELRAERNDA